jgi:membrane protein
MKKLIALVFAIKNFLLKEIWMLSHNSLSPVKRTLVKQIKIFLITIRGFMENKVVIRASALTFYTMMSVVPLEIGRAHV